MRFGNANFSPFDFSDPNDRVDDTSITQGSTLFVRLYDKREFDLTHFALSKGINLDGISTYGAGHSVTLSQADGTESKFHINKIIAFYDTLKNSGTPQYTFNDLLAGKPFLNASSAAPQPVNREAQTPASSAPSHPVRFSAPSSSTVITDWNNPLSITSCELNSAGPIMTLRNGTEYNLTEFFQSNNITRVNGISSNQAQLVVEALTPQGLKQHSFSVQSIIDFHTVNNQSNRSNRNNM